MHVVFVVIDALPIQWVGPDSTPNLWALANEGGWNPDDGEAILSTSTYPNRASFLTGRDGTGHGLFSNRVWDGEEFVDSHRVGPKGETLFSAASTAGVSTAVVVGDHKLIGVMGAAAADRHWPPGGRRADVDLDEFRYAADSAVIDAVDEIDVFAADFAFVHFNEPDTACHRHGPDAAETGEQIRSTDAALGRLIDRLQAQWQDTVVIVVSDHTQETVTAHGLDLAAALAERDLPGVVEAEGTAAVVIDGPSVDELRQLDIVDDAAALDDRHCLVWGRPGEVFGFWLDELHGSHGSPRCATQVAVVGGGHPRVGELAEAVAARRPNATDWAPTIAALLGFGLPAATGSSLIS